MQGCAGGIKRENRWWLCRSSIRWDGGKEGMSKGVKRKLEGERKKLRLEEVKAGGRKEGRKEQAARQAGRLGW